jgi:hypothetical protein
MKEQSVEALAPLAPVARKALPAASLSVRDPPPAV